MDLKELLGESFKDGMTVEEITEALAKVEMPKPSDNSDEIAKLKKIISDANSEAKKYKDELKAKMSDDERKAKEDAEKWEAVVKERDALLREKNISEHTAKFLANGYSAELADKSAKALVDGDFDTVFKYLGDYRAEIEKQFKAQNIKDMPKPQGGGDGGNKAITKEQFDAMSYTEQLAVFNNQPDVYNELTK